MRGPKGSKGGGVSIQGPTAHLGCETLGTIPSVYVGTSAVTIQPVYMLRLEPIDEVDINLGDNSTNLAAVSTLYTIFELS